MKKLEKLIIATFHKLKNHYFPFRSTQQKVVPYRILHGLSSELFYFTHRVTCKKLLLYYTVVHRHGGSSQMIFTNNK